MPTSGDSGKADRVNSQANSEQLGVPAYLPPANVAWLDGLDHAAGEELYLTMVPEGTTVLLRGSARLIWLAAIETPDSLARVAEQAGVPAEEIEGDVTAFLVELTDRGLLTRRADAADASDRQGEHPAPTRRQGDGVTPTDLAGDAAAPTAPDRLASPAAHGRSPRVRRSLDKVRRHAGQRADQLFAMAGRRLGPRPDTPAWDGDPRIALLTVNFSTTRYLKLMLSTLAEQDDLDLLHRIVICDNASRDNPEPLLSALESGIDRVTVIRNPRPYSHARGMRSALRALREAEQYDARPANILLFCDTDVVFRNPGTLRALADLFVDEGVAFAGELRRGLFDYPEAQASFLAVRRDWADRRQTAPWVDHGSPAYWLQRSIWRQGGQGADFPSNLGGFILHRGRAGVAAARRFIPRHHLRDVAYVDPHFMGVPNGATIWDAVESRHAELLDERNLAGLLASLAAALGSPTRGPAASDAEGPVTEPTP